MALQGMSMDAVTWPENFAGAEAGSADGADTNELFAAMLAGLQLAPPPPVSAASQPSSAPLPEQADNVAVSAVAMVSPPTGAPVSGPSALALERGPLPARAPEPTMPPAVAPGQPRQLLSTAPLSPPVARAKGPAVGATPQAEASADMPSPADALGGAGFVARPPVEIAEAQPDRGEVGHVPLPEGPQTRTPQAAVGPARSGAAQPPEDATRLAPRSGLVAGPLPPPAPVVAADVVTRRTMPANPERLPALEPRPATWQEALLTERQVAAVEQAFGRAQPPDAVAVAPARPLTTASAGVLVARPQLRPGLPAPAPLGTVPVAAAETTAVVAVSDLVLPWSTHVRSGTTPVRPPANDGYAVDVSRRAEMRRTADALEVLESSPSGVVAPERGDERRPWTEMPATVPPRFTARAGDTDAAPVAPAKVLSAADQTPPVRELQVLVHHPESGEITVRVLEDEPGTVAAAVHVDRPLLPPATHRLEAGVRAAVAQEGLQLSSFELSHHEGGGRSQHPAGGLPWNPLAARQSALRPSRPLPLARQPAAPVGAVDRYA